MKKESKQIIKRLALKFFCVLLLLVAMDVAYYFTLYQKDLDQHCPIKLLSQKALTEQADIVYLAESSNGSHAPYDTSTLPISTLIGEMLPEQQVSNLAQNACHAAIYYDVLNNIPRSAPVKVAVVTVNMRSFGCEWIYSDLEPALQKWQVMMHPGPALYRRLLLGLSDIRPWNAAEREQLILEKLKEQTLTPTATQPYRNASEWDHAFAQAGMLYNGQPATGDTLALACHHIKHFALTLDETNPRIQDFDRIVQLCKKRGFTLVFNILAENTDQIKDWVGPELNQILHRNAEFVIQRYEPQGVIVVNNLDAVRSSSFFEHEFPTEHYDFEGRKAIARNVAKALKDR